MTTPPRKILAYLHYKQALTIHDRYLVLISICTLCGVVNLRAESFDGSIKPLLKQYCVNCHGGEETNADVNFLQIPLKPMSHDSSNCGNKRCNLLMTR